MTYIIDWEKVDRLLICGAEGTEIAPLIGIPVKTLYRKTEEEKNMSFGEYRANKRAHGDALLKVQQFSKAVGWTKKGSDTQLIWLGKCRLGQREIPLDSQEVPSQKNIDLSHELMQVKNQFAEYKANANKPQTG